MVANAYFLTFLQLDRSSPQFPDRLCDVLNGMEFDEHISGLEADDLAEVIDYLDKVPSLYQLQLASTEPTVGVRWSRTR